LGLLAALLARLLRSATAMLAAALSWLLVLLARLLSTAAMVTDAAPRLSRDPGAFAHLCGSA
jgi:hypothetical protein